MSDSITKTAQIKSLENRFRYRIKVQNRKNISYGIPTSDMKRQCDSQSNNVSTNTTDKKIKHESNQFND